MPRDQRLHQVSISTVTSLTGRPSTVKTRFETVAVDSIVAQREDHQTWGCQPVTPDQKPQVYTYLVLVPPHPHSVETIGPGTLRGTPIWWVRMTQAPGYTLMGPILLAIAQDSYRLVE